MAYAQVTPVGQDDLVTKINTFLVTTDGQYTQDDLDLPNDEAAWHLTSPASQYISMEWDLTHLGLHHALGFTPGNSPGAHPNDSGNGGVGASDRRVNDIGNGSYTTCHFFSNFPTAPPAFFYCVLEYASGLYRHFGWGDLVKVGNWTGGTFCYGANWDQSAGGIDDPKGSSHSVLLDSDGSTVARAPTVHMVGFQDQPASGKWGVCTASTSAGNDGDGNGRALIIGGSRGGPYMNSFGVYNASVLTGIVPAIPIHLFYRNLTPSPDRWYELGMMPDCRMVQMENLQPAEEFTVGGQTWIAFPISRKQFLKNDTEESWNMGVAYRKT
jgi:hypothetical protein